MRKKKAMWGKKKGREGLSCTKKHFPLNIWNHLRFTVFVRVQHGNRRRPRSSGRALGPGLLCSVTVLWVVTMCRALCLLLENCTLDLQFSVFEYNSQTTLMLGTPIRKDAFSNNTRDALAKNGLYWVIFLDEGTFCGVLFCLLVSVAEGDGLDKSVRYRVEVWWLAGRQNGNNRIENNTKSSWPV